MRDALLRDLSSLPYDITTTVDTRLKVPMHCQICHMIEADDAVWDIWEELIATVDAVWLIAPETDGALSKLTRLAQAYDKYVIGSGAAVIDVCSSKLATYQALAPTIKTVDTYLYADWPKTQGVTWLAKPDDGAGCEQTACFDSAEALDDWLQQQQYTESHIMQPYLVGTPASIACIMHQGKVQLLSCNQQLIEKDEHTLIYQGCIVNGLQQYWEPFFKLASDVATLMPDLTGYIGIDVIVHEAEKGEQLFTLVEVNPRLTTSYIALAEATAYNPAALLMHTLTQADYQWPTIEKNSVVLEVDHA